jgi:hypothetical protein
MYAGETEERQQNVSVWGLRAQQVQATWKSSFFLRQ